ncbi:hypothetical protein SPHS8_00497 [Sphingobium sp. S8]|nr:hypothetical protein SPHS8_00497 [Sphingobium sp. S8]
MAAMIPTWAQTVGAMVEHGTKVQATCTRCRSTQIVDPRRILLIKGPDYSLVNRRCRCRMTEDCPGWNRFHYLHGVMRPLWRDEDVLIRWFGE